MLSRTSGLGVCAAAVYAVGGVVGLARAQPGLELGRWVDLPQSTLPDGGRLELDELIEDLGAPEFELRQRAFETLRDNSRITLKAIEGALKRKDLSAEALARLSAAGLSRFGQSPRGAVGFAFGNILPDRITVGELFPRFPASKTLEVGDMIVEADGFRLEGTQGRYLLQCLIISHDPGEKMKMVVRRGAQKVPLEVELGNFADLQQGGFLPTNRFPTAWRLRVARLSGRTEQAAAVNVPAGAWGPKIDPVAEQRRLERLKMSQEPAVEVAGGGMPRAGLDVSVGTGLGGNDPGRVFVQQMIQQGGRVRVLNFPQQAMDFDLDASRPAMTPDEELGRLVRNRLTLQRELAGQPAGPGDAVIIDPRAGGGGDLRSQLELTQKYIAAVEAERAEAASAEPRGE